MLDTIKDIRFNSVNNYNKYQLNNIVYQTRPIFESSISSNFMKRYSDYKCFGIGRCLFLILKLTKNKYNLNEIQEYILTQNMSIALDKYSKLVKTDDLDICIYKNNVGDLYTLEIDEEFINNIKLITSGKNNLLYNKLGDLIIDDYNLLNHPIFEYDIKKILSDNNINSSDLFSLITYTKDIKLINRYIKLLSSDDIEFNKLLLEFIKPATYYLQNFLYGNNVLNYIKDESITNDIEKCKKFYDEGCSSINLYLIKLFENYFINKIDVLEEISMFKNRCEILNKMITAKKEILSLKNIYSIETTVYEVEEPDREYVYYVDGPNQFKPGYYAREIIPGGFNLDIDNNFRENEIDIIYKETDDIFQDIINNQEVPVEKLRIKDRKI